MTVYGNVFYATKDRQRTMELLELTRLTKLERHFPHELSGRREAAHRPCAGPGQKPQAPPPRRTALGPRRKPPLSLGDELCRIQRETGVTAILVSHSREEISRLCTEVLELADGRILGAGAEDRFD